jgi:hypothetical protein
MNNMDTLIAISSSPAYFYKRGGAFFPGSSSKAPTPISIPGVDHHPDIVQEVPETRQAQAISLLTFRRDARVLERGRR